MPLTKKKNREEDVYKALRQDILSKKLYPNTQLVETAIAQKMGISRTPVRDAIKRLAYEGLVNIIPRKGAYIVCPTKEEFLQLFTCRLHLETKAVELAASQITDEEIQELEQLMHVEQDCFRRKSVEEYITINKQIHMTMVRACRNDYFIKYIEELISKSDIYLIFYDNFLFKREEDVNSFKEHKKLLDALKNRDPKKSYSAMEAHVKSIFENLDQVF